MHYLPHLLLSIAVPEITFPPENFVITVDQFQEAIFSCAAAGIPPPDISWVRQQGAANTTLQPGASTSIGSPVQLEDYVLMSVMGVVVGVNRSLTLIETMDGDSGDYFCVANTSAGEDSRRFQVVVQGK